MFFPDSRLSADLLDFSDSIAHRSRLRRNFSRQSRILAAHTHTCSRNSRWRHNGRCNSRLIIARFPLRNNRKQKSPIALITIGRRVQEGRNSHTRSGRECREEPMFDVRRVWPTRLRKRLTVTCSKHVTFSGFAVVATRNIGETLKYADIEYFRSEITGNRVCFEHPPSRQKIARIIESKKKLHSRNTSGSCICRKKRGRHFGRAAAAAKESFEIIILAAEAATQHQKSSRSIVRLNLRVPKRSRP